MKNRTTAIIITVAVALLCACLPLCAGLVGAIDWMMGTNWFGMGDDVGLLGGAGVCLGLLGIIAAVVVGIFTLRKKNEDVLPTDEPLPPAY